MGKLRGVKPEAIEKRLKMFLFGIAGVGKTTAAIQFPRPYLIDTERGAENEQYVQALNAAGGSYFTSTDLDEIIAEVQALSSEPHEYRTLIIDPMTVPYNAACDKAARELAAEKGEGDGTEFGRHKGRADRYMKRLLELLLRLDMNVIVTSHAKDKWVKVGNDFKQAGTTFDCYSKLDYLFDLVIEVEKRGQERAGIVRKTRIQVFPEGDVFPFSYAQIAERYGHAILERQAAPIPMATPDQVTTLQGFVEAFNVPQEKVAQWCEKANAESFEQFTEAKAAELIALLQAKIRSPTDAHAA